MKKLMKIILVLVSAFLVADFSNKNLFLSNSPKFNRFFASQIKQLIENKYNSLALRFKDLTKINIALIPSGGGETTSQPLSNQSGFEMQKQPDIQEILTDAVLNQTNKGVYAGEYEGTKVFKYIQSEIIWASRTYTLSNGKTVTVRYPEGIDAPLQESVEAAYGD